MGQADQDRHRIGGEGEIAPGVRISVPVHRLAQLVLRAGGRTREEAVGSAESRVAQLRDPVLFGIDKLIGELELKSAPERLASPASLQAVQSLADQIACLAITFELHALSDAARMLCDLAGAFIARADVSARAIEVTVQAMRLLGPRSTAAGLEAGILGQLRSVLVHFDIPAASAGQTARS